jgi:hypothetical protein
VFVVNYSPGFRWLVGLLLPLTLLLKFAVGAEDPGEFNARIANFLAERGFKSVTIEEVTSGIQLVRANSGECRLFVVDVSGKGWTKELIRNLSGTDDRIFTVFRGAVYEQAPTWLTATNDLYFRILQKLGLARAGLVIGVSASPVCNAERLPWNEV